MLRYVFFFMLLLLASCYTGSVHSKSNQGNLSFIADTVFASLNSDGSMDLLLTWVAIDPNRDLEELGQKRLNQVMDAFWAHEALWLRLPNQKTLAPGQHFTLSLSGEEGVVRFEGEAKKEGSYGSLRVLDMSLDEVSETHLKGRMDIYVSRTDTDPENAKEGHLKLWFTAPIASGIAYQNMQRLIHNLL